jgi:5-formyltetrahydrofolate cyclo-ligase
MPSTTWNSGMDSKHKNHNTEFREAKNCIHTYVCVFVRMRARVGGGGGHANSYFSDIEDNRCYANNCRSEHE